MGVKTETMTFGLLNPLIIRVLKRLGGCLSSILVGDCSVLGLLNLHIIWGFKVLTLSIFHISVQGVT